MPQLDVRMLRTALKKAVLKTRQQNMCLPFIQRNYDLLEGVASRRVFWCATVSSSMAIIAMSPESHLEGFRRCENGLSSRIRRRLFPGIRCFSIRQNGAHDAGHLGNVSGRAYRGGEWLPLPRQITGAAKAFIMTAMLRRRARPVASRRALAMTHLR